MNNWSDGYFTDIHYTYGYYKQLNPSELRLAALAGGFAPVHNEDFNYLELGFGQGVSINVHAAASGGTYWGTDFNPVHAANARELTAASGAQTRLSDDSFLELAARKDLPDFDYIALHGIWSWISDENREVIVDLIRRKLRTGGIVYVSYNTFPGWAPFIPIRQMLSLFKDNVGALTGAEGGIFGAMQFTNEVFAAGADYYKDIPALTRHLDSLKEHGPSYIAHEYLNADWKLSTFADVARQLGEAKLSYAGPTRLLDNIEPLRFTPDAQKLLGRIGDPILRETVKDFLTNQIFRCDVYVKGLRRIPQGEFFRRWSEQLFVMTVHKSELPQEIVLPYAKIKLHEQMLADVIDVMVEHDYAPKTIAQLRAHPNLAHASADEIIETMMLLVGAGHASTAQVPTPEIVDRCEKLNRHVRDRALVAREVEYLASPITGGAVNVPHICLLFLDALDEGRSTAQELATHAWERFQGFGKRIKQDGTPVESREESLANLEPMAQRFLASMLPMLKTLQAI